MSCPTKTNKIRTKDVEIDDSTVSFEDLQLDKEILKGLNSAGFYRPSPVQLKAIPLGKLGLDLIVQAKSGTGKTCVFSVIALEHVLANRAKTLQVLILAPTREVAMQICSVIKSISSAFKVNTHAFIGGQTIKEDKIKLRNCQIAVGTPGRILHLITENILSTVNMRMFILDEADKLLAPEFQDNINLIYSKLPHNKQMLSLSATYPSYMATYVTRYMRSATFVRLNKVDPSLRGIRQYYKITPHSDLPNATFNSKVNNLIKLFSNIQFQQSIVFINYQLKAESLCKSLKDKGWPSIYISGHIDQAERNQAIDQLKNFKCRILVSTDLTARGIDAQNVDLIVCMDLAADPETYLHRIGRAGRYGCKGTAVSFICEKDEASLFDDIIDSYNLRITQFGEDLNDVVCTKNDSDEIARVDDVTIEKVTLSKEKLDQSLFEYEFFKNCSEKNKNTKTKDFTNITTDSNRLNQLLDSSLFQDIKNNFNMFIQGGKTENIHVDHIQDEYNELTDKMSFKITRDMIAENQTILHEGIEKCLISECNEKYIEISEVYDLKELYKWNTVSEKITEETKVNKVDLQAEQSTFRDKGHTRCLRWPRPLKQMIQTS